MSIGRLLTRFFNGKYIFLNKDKHGKQRIIEIDEKQLERFEIYYYEVKGHTYYYVNVHVKYTEDPAEIIDFFNRILDIIHVYRTEKLKQGIDKVSVYIIGDYNFNIATPNILEHAEKATYTGKTSGKTTNLYGGDQLKIFGNVNLTPKRKITSMYKLTTKDAECFSLMDNQGHRNPCNIDCILKLDLASS